MPLEIAIELAGQQAQSWLAHDPDQQADRIAMRGELGRLMQMRIDRLPNVYRTVFVRRAVEELSVNEIASALKISEAIVRTRFFRARGAAACFEECAVTSAPAATSKGQDCDRAAPHPR